MTAHKSQQGFTLIELLVVILIISILGVTVFVALNPVKRFSDARDSRRWSDVESILTSVHEYVVDNGGSLPAGITTTVKQLGSCVTGGATLCPTAAVACLDLSGGSLLGKYLKAIPADPKSGTAATTGYSIVTDANNIVTVAACASESGAVSSSR